ncbi:MAG: AraC family transcriptional regulator [Lachnospiraceae bacterium]|nr:AraC family transcriptional regulator [Lachnospiraceae bacterium]
MDRHALKIPCNVMPFVCEADYSVSLGKMIHADRTAPFHVAIYLLRGFMEIIEDGVHYELLPHRLFFLKSGVHHWGEKPFEEGSAWYYAHFYCGEPDERMQELPDNVYYDTKVCLEPSANEKYITIPKLTDCDGASRVQRNFEKLLKAHVHGNIPQASVNLWQIFLECARKDAEDHLENAYVRKLREYIHAHYIEGFDAETVERVCGLSYKYAGTLFREAVGQTIREYQRTLRIRRAKQLLQETDKSVTEIAQFTGFSDVFYFSKVFHAEQGCSPSEYRRTYIPGI